MAKMKDDGPKSRTRSFTTRGGVQVTKTVTKDKGYRKVEKSKSSPTGAYLTDVRERMKTPTGKKSSRSIVMDKEFTGSYPSDYGTSYYEYSRNKDKTKRSAYSGKGPRKTVSMSQGSRYSVGPDGKAPGYTAYDTRSMKKEKNAKGKGRVMKSYEDTGYDTETGKRMKPIKMTRTKGKTSIVNRLKKSM